MRICTFDTLRVTIAGRVVPLVGSKARALIGYLALSETGEETRERIAGLLWSEVDQEKARQSLRASLHEIRTAFEAAGFSGLRSDKIKIGLDKSSIQVDLVEVLDLARRGEPHELLLSTERAFEGLLRDVEDVDQSFRIWLMAKRRTLENRVTGWLEATLRSGMAGQPARASVARALINLDPTHEEAARALIRARATEGDVGGAFRIYKELWDLLAEEHDCEPAQETQDLIVSLKMEQEGGGIEPPEAPAPALGFVGLREAVAAPTGLAKPAQTARQPGTRLAVAIAAFDVAGTREENRYLVQGFRRELIASLVRFREWVVRDQGIGPGTAAPQPSFDEYVIEASAFESGGAVRLVLMLRDASTNAYLWSERFQVSMESWFDAQQAVVRRLATAMNVHVSAERMRSISLGADNTLEVYDQWLRGQALIVDFTPTSWKNAIEIYEQIVIKEPNFAPAYVGLAQLHTTIHFAYPGIDRDGARERKALEFAREAARLDPVNSRAQLCLGWAYAMMAQYDQASTHYELAVELNESDPWTLISASVGFGFSDDLVKARRLSDEAFQLARNPTSAYWGYRCTSSFLCGDYADAVHSGRQAGDPANYVGWLVAALGQLGRIEEATAELTRFFASAKRSWPDGKTCSSEAMTDWFLRSFPIRSRACWERLRDGIVAAGAPVILSQA